MSDRGFDEGAHVAGGSASSEPEPVLSALGWRTSYDRESLERFVAEVELERSRLLAEIAAARLSASSVEAPPSREIELSSLLAAVQAELAALEADHRRVIAEIHDAADAEATRILEDARAQIAEVRGQTDRVVELLGSSGAPVGWRTDAGGRRPARTPGPTDAG